MKTYKAIAYAYPTSLAADHFGFKNQGCYYIQLIHRGENYYSEAAPGSEGFADINDMNLRSLFAEFHYPIDIQSKKYHPEFYKERI